MERYGGIIKARLAFSTIGVIIGVSAGAVFGIHFKNYNAGIWGLCSGISALVALCVTIAYMRRAWDPFPHRLRSFMLTGCFIQLAGVCGFVAYMVLAISKNQGVSAYNNGFYIASVWCFMTWKWGFLLLIYARSYHRTYQMRQDILNIIAESKGQHHTQQGYNTFEGSS